MDPWRQYQHDVAHFFRQLGMAAETDVTIPGVRTRHAVDVVVDSVHSGFPVRWLIECKHWKSRIPKEVVHNLRTIVSDTGADRGIIMAENGFQSGAIEASSMSSVSLTSLVKLRSDLSNELAAVEYALLEERIDVARERYWAMSKTHRIDTGLRPDSIGYGYSGDFVLKIADAAIRHARRHGFPFRYDLELGLGATVGAGSHRPRGEPGECVIETSQALIVVVDADLTELEHRLAKAEGSVERSCAQPAAAQPQCAPDEVPGV